MPTRLSQDQIDGLDDDLNSLDGRITSEDSINDAVDAGLALSLTQKQETLISGTNIKTINGLNVIGSGNLIINPRVLGFSGVMGTQTSATDITICHSLLIPANTLGINNILQVVFRMFRQNGNTGQITGRVYFNTTNTLVGATLFNTTFTMNGSSSQNQTEPGRISDTPPGETGTSPGVITAGNLVFNPYIEINFAYDGSVLSTFLESTGSSVSTNFDRGVDNYILFTMQVEDLSDTANIDLYKILLYA